MDSFSGTTADLFRQPFGIPGSSDCSSGTLKRKRARDDLGPPSTSNSTIENLKRAKVDEASCLPFPEYNGLGELVKDRMPDSSVWSKAIAVCVPGHQPHKLNDSGGFRVLQSDQSFNGYYKKPQPNLKHLWRKRPASCTSDEGSDSHTRKITRYSKKDSMTIVERKHFFIHTPTVDMEAVAKKHFSDIYQLLDLSGSNDDCRLHPTPPQYNGKAAGAVSFGLNWRDDHGPHRLSINWGIIALVVRQELTDAQKYGFINHSWQLSHLCGNWTCCNWRHFTVESGPINVSRNGCFNSPAKCAHHPPCMKEKKRQLLVTDHIRRAISRAITSLGGILSYEAFHTLGEHDIRLVEWFWENSRRGTCAFCGRSDARAHVCSCLSSLQHCRIMLRALKLCIEPDSVVGDAMGLLVKIKEDLERCNAIKINTYRCTKLNSTYLQLRNTERDLRRKRFELGSKPRPERTAEDVRLLAEVKSLYGQARSDVHSARREWEQAEIARLMFS